MPKSENRSVIKISFPMRFSSHKVRFYVAKYGEYAPVNSTPLADKPIE